MVADFSLEQHVVGGAGVEGRPACAGRVKVDQVYAPVLEVVAYYFEVIPKVEFVLPARRPRSSEARSRVQLVIWW